jgi:hypothetical protein
MSSPAHNIVIGSVMGTGSAIDVKTVGFRPKRVEGFNSDGDYFIWQKDMADASMHKRIDSTGVGSVPTSNGITPLADGFRIGADADLNQNNKRIYYTCWAE